MKKDGTEHPAWDEIHQKRFNETTSNPETVEQQAQLQRDHFELNGRRIEFLGVRHTPETVKKFEQEFREAIEHAAVVVLEYTPTAWGVYTPEGIERLRKIGKLLGYEVTTEEAQEFVKNNMSGGFFSEIERLVHESGKKLASMDPHDTEQMITRGMNDHQMKQYLYMSAVGYAGLLGMFTEMIQSIKELRSKTWEQEGQQKEKQNKSRGMTRRTFIRGMMGTMAAVGIGASALNHPLMMVKFDQSRGPLGKLVHNSIDYRNIVVSEGLDRLSKQQDLPNGPILVIYGLVHMKSIREYVKDNEMRHDRFEDYGDYDKIAREELRIYEPNDNGGFTKVHSEPLFEEVKHRNPNS